MCVTDGSGALSVLVHSVTWSCSLRPAEPLLSSHSQLMLQPATPGLLWIHFEKRIDLTSLFCSCQLFLLAYIQSSSQLMNCFISKHNVHFVIIHHIKHSFQTEDCHILNLFPHPADIPMLMQTWTLSLLGSIASEESNSEVTVFHQEVPQCKGRFWLFDWK